SELQKHLAGYARVNEWMQDKISFEVFSLHVKQTLKSYTKSNLYMGGGITFCSLIPMRSIPFKVVALLGINFDNFPRNEKKQNFNLMLQNPKPGDRNLKDNDKHLFLETLLSAQEYFYISYQGMDAKTNQPTAPSVLVDELLDYIEDGLSEDRALVRTTLITLQPLHLFSYKYRTQPHLYNYLLRSSPQQLDIWKDELTIPTTSI